MSLFIYLFIFNLQASRRRSPSHRLGDLPLEPLPAQSSSSSVTNLKRFLGFFFFKCSVEGAFCLYGVGSILSSQSITLFNSSINFRGVKNFTSSMGKVGLTHDKSPFYFFPHSLINLFYFILFYFFLINTYFLFSAIEITTFFFLSF